MALGEFVRQHPRAADPRYSLCSFAMAPFSQEPAMHELPLPPWLYVAAVLPGAWPSWSSRS